MNQRLQVVISHSGLCSRRKAEELIASGHVAVNGKLITKLGTSIDPLKDKVTVDRKPIPKPESLVYFRMYKPVGIVSTVSDPDGKKTVLSVFSRWYKKAYPSTPIPRVYPVGRLDEESEGLLILTNDGDFSYQLTHPKFEVEKTYQVLVKGTPTNTQLNQLSRGIRFKEGMAMATHVAVVKHDQGNTWIEITIHQGMHHQVRRMCAGVNLEVTRLIRIRMSTYELDNLRPGDIQQITKETNFLQ